MRYSVAQIEDQILATLREDTVSFGDAVMIDTLAGQVNPQMFFNPELMQGFIRLLPFVLVSYQGRVGKLADADSGGQYYKHILTFRLYTGAQSLRRLNEATRGCYDMNAAIYDDIHGKIPNSTPQRLTGFTALSGQPITIPEFTPMSPFYETGGQDEALVVNLPGIVVYKSDFNFEVMA